ncbi:predicted protein [Pyrenophora tritici-repentis Pt-1C-BFP]|uniref:Uncharacterized protein n=1 Tax=Pyrenophora tritici-repentis (strain Pt-1C-BFP) TaxID=426418 RepID=B2VTR7_PYRTR|nr:uncharacterized protein PTRG_00912 [Pyrenophora tritici-repentis Pt-1C-BFP]EDU40350.1 predicted protein [Pyrenophora tritici-repentis Pt-1C-BFP]
MRCKGGGWQVAGVRHWGAPAAAIDAALRIWLSNATLFLFVEWRNPSIYFV